MIYWCKTFLISDCVSRAFSCCWWLRYPGDNTVYHENEEFSRATQVSLTGMPFPRSFYQCFSIACERLRQGPVWNFNLWACEWVGQVACKVASSGKALLDHHQEGGCWKTYTYWDTCARPTICACFFCCALVQMLFMQIGQVSPGTIEKTYGTGSRRWLHESSSMELAPYHIMLQ